MQASASFSVSYLMIWSSLSIVLQSAAQLEPQVPCFFVFGDSYSDYGNNNNLQTLAKVNYMPYGIDDYRHFENVGRFSNDLTITDFISVNLDFMIPSMSFASIDTLEESVILKGVNYASGSAGIRSETGQHWGARIPLDQQLMNHRTVVSKIDNILGSESTSYLSQCLYTINMGSSDYLFNYFMPENYSTSQDYTPEEYAKVLINQYSQQIQTLYGMGARKVALFALLELGWIPYSVGECGFHGIECRIARSEASAQFNEELRKLVDKLNSNLTDAKFTCINVDYTCPLPHIGSGWGLLPCCRVKSNGLCKEGKNDRVVCNSDDRNKYMFFDSFHLTHNHNYDIAKRAYTKYTHFDVYPVDIRTLVLT